MEKGSHHEGLSCRVENPVHLLLCLSCSPTTTSRLHLDHRPFPTSVANSNTRCWVTVACGGVYASLRGHSFHLCATSAPAAILLTQHYSIYHTTSCDTTVIARSAHPPSVSKVFTVCPRARPSPCHSAHPASTSDVLTTFGSR
jgi:hypothetical protein